MMKNPPDRYNILTGGFFIILRIFFLLHKIFHSF